jgi:hypothetical protein
MLVKVSGLLTDEFVPRKTFVKEGVKGEKPVTVNWALNQLIKGGFVEQVLSEEGEKMVKLVKEFDGKTEEPRVLKRAPQRERKTLTISEEDAKGLGLLTLRTPPVKKDLVYPDGVTKEMFDDFKGVIIKNAELLKDLVTNFNGARGTAITMWEPSHEKANEDGKVFYRWDEPVNTWELMVQLCKVVELYNAQEAVEEE